MVRTRLLSDSIWDGSGRLQIGSLLVSALIQGMISRQHPLLAVDRNSRTLRAFTSVSNTGKIAIFVVAFGSKSCQDDLKNLQI